MSSSDESLKRPLTARLESFDGTDDDNLQRDSPSPHTMLASQLNEYHHYANPQELVNGKSSSQEEIELDRLNSHGRKKNNLVYESSSSSSTQSGRKKNNLLYESSQSKAPPLPQNHPVQIANDAYVEEAQYRKRRRYRELILIMITIFALSALIVSLLSVFGVIQLKKNNNGNGPTPRTEKLSGKSTVVHGSKLSEETVHQLQHNMTQLKKHVIPSLLKKIENLENQLDQIPKEGVVGPTGPPGPPGAGDFSKCKYMMYEKKGYIKQDKPEESEVTSSYINETEDQFIMGITCSTKGAAQHELIQKRSSKGQRQFGCKCAGKSDVPAFKTLDNAIFCSIHFWQCPMKT